VSKANHNLSRLLDKPGTAELTVFFYYKKIAFRLVWGIAVGLPLDDLKTVRITVMMAISPGKYAVECIIALISGKRSPRRQNGRCYGTDEEWGYITSDSL
jgi:hypothetical protein